MIGTTTGANISSSIGVTKLRITSNVLKDPSFGTIEDGTNGTIACSSCTSHDGRNSFVNRKVDIDVDCVTWKQKLERFFRKYFMDGQKLEDGKQEEEQSEHIDPNAPFYKRHRKLIAIVLPAIVVHSIWWSIMIPNNYFYLFTEASGSLGKPRYYMSLTMILGSLVAGATSEGGGAVAFPVMTLLLGVTPTTARDFSFMIQSVGMVASSFTILFMRVAVEWKALLYVSTGGIFGIIIGLEKIVPRFTPSYSKMYFVSIWASFAFGLFLLNRNYDRKVNDKIINWDSAVIWKAPGPLKQFIQINWKRELLVTCGILGGIFSAMAGSGIDICSFAFLTLLFRVSEKVATPTSVILMAINTLFGFLYRQFAMGGVADDTWGYLAVCTPIVVFGAPIGAFLGSHWHRLTLASVVYLLDFIQLIGALYVIRPWTYENTDTPTHLLLSSVGLFISGTLFFHAMSYCGLQMLKKDGMR